MSTNVSQIQEYESIAHNMNEKGRYKLANNMAHGYKIARTDLMVELTREDGKCIILDSEGNQWIATPAI